ncbi:hypothetical protein Q8A73_006830 [Channa argus]|nr:hypothetical protein Q8A73_006830 [Channa argus]
MEGVEERKTAWQPWGISLPYCLPLVAGVSVVETILDNSSFMAKTDVYDSAFSDQGSRYGSPSKALSHTTVTPAQPHSALPSPAFSIPTDFEPGRKNPNFTPTLWRTSEEGC